MQTFTSLLIFVCSLSIAGGIHQLYDQPVIGILTFPADNNETEHETEHTSYFDASYLKCEFYLGVSLGVYCVCAYVPVCVSE